MNSTEIVKRYYEAFNAKNWGVMLSLLDSNIRHDANQGNSHFGLEYFTQFLAHMDECYDEELKDLVFMTDESGARIAVEFTVHGTYKKTDGDLPEASGQTYVLPAGAFLAVNNGKISRVSTYYNLEDWINQINGKS
jgi:steroid delta-isomerase-like uncharacterized protein